MKKPNYVTISKVIAKNYPAWFWAIL